MALTASPWRIESGSKYVGIRRQQHFRNLVGANGEIILPLRQYVSVEDARLIAAAPALLEALLAVCGWVTEGGADEYEFEGSVSAELSFDDLRKARAALVHSLGQEAATV